MTATPGIATLALQATPGQSCLSISTSTGASESRVAYILSVIEGRTTRILLHQEADGHIHSLLFFPSSRPEAPSDPVLLQRLDMAQHFLFGGKLGEVSATVEPLLAPSQPDTLDPIVGCLAGHLMIRERQFDRLEALGNRMLALYPDLPDSHVLRAFHRDAMGKASEAVDAYVAALDRGLPITAHLVHRLAEGVVRRKIQHPRNGLLAEVAVRLVPGALWTAWLPDPGWDGAPPENLGRDLDQVDIRDLDQSTRSDVKSLANFVTGATTMEDQAPVTFDPKAFQISKDAPLAANVSTTPGLCGNQPMGGPYLASDPSTKAQSTKAVADTALTWANGKTLKVVFLNGDNDAWGQKLQQAVRDIAPTWSDYANIKFEFVPPPQAHITINFSPSLGSGYNSWMGTQSLKFVGKQPTMNLVFDQQSLGSDPNFIQSEFNRVILHEFGHAIGFIHEHYRPDRPITFDEQALLRNFGPGTANNWTVEMIHQQIIDPYKSSEGSAALLGGAFDLTSIMMYQYPPGIATYSDGTPFQTPNNVKLSPLDKVVANMLYPATGVTDPDEAVLAPGDDPTPGSIDQAGQVVRFSFTPSSTGVHMVETQGSTPLLVSLLSQRDDPAGKMLAAEGPTASLAFLPKNSGATYFVQVRHALPMSGTGPFSISVRAQS